MNKSEKERIDTMSDSTPKLSLRDLAIEVTRRCNMGITIEIDTKIKNNG